MLVGAPYGSNVAQRVIEPIIMGLDLSAVGARINHVEIGGQERVQVAISDQGDTDRDMFLVDASYRLAPDTIRPGAPDTFFSMTVDKATSFDIAAKTARVEFTYVVVRAGLSCNGSLIPVSPLLGTYCCRSRRTTPMTLGSTFRSGATPV